MMKKTFALFLCFVFCISWLSSCVAEQIFPGMAAPTVGQSNAHVFFAEKKKKIRIGEGVQHLVQNIGQQDDTIDLSRLPVNNAIAEIENLRNSSEVAASTKDGRDVPQSIGVLNAYKKAHQMMDIKWTPKANVTSKSDGRRFSKGTRAKGIPYSSVKEYSKFVPLFVSLKTFMTAVNNPYSVLYTENVSHGGRSAYGNEYVGSNCAPYYGMVCSSFVFHALGFNVYYSTAEFAYLCEKGVLEQIDEQSALGVQLMDILWEPGHCRLVTDIYRNAQGIPTAIHVSEAIGMTTRTTVYTVDGFNQRLKRKKGIIYRYPEIYKNTEYEASPFVAVAGEEISEAYVYNNDICTYAGDCAAFRTGEKIFINYTKGDYSSMEVYRDDTLVETMPLDSSGAVHVVDLTPCNLPYGMYKARLTNGNEHSDYTYFEIIDTNVSCRIINESLSVDFHSENSQPLYAQLCYRNGTSRGIYEFTPEDLEAGNAVINVTEVVLSQYPGKYLSDITYLKVFFVGEYGTVCNDLLDTGLVQNKVN